ncbi:MAG: hypothetical protein ACUVQY_07965 [Thermoproteota archaeon]
MKNRYPCGEGGWMHHRVLFQRELEDVEELIKIIHSEAEEWHALKPWGNCLSGIFYSYRCEAHCVIMD